MSRMSDIHIEIADLIEQGSLSFQEIAKVVGVSYEWVNDVAESLNEFYDSMDGDYESALASVGWGTDEDYGYYGD